MAGRLGVVAVLLGVVGSQASLEAGGGSGNGLDNSDTVEGTIKQVISKECKSSYSSGCLKLGLLRLVSRTAPGSMALLPGVTMSWSRPPTPVVSSSLLEAPEVLDGLLLDTLGEALSNISLNVRILDKDTPLSFVKAYLGDSSIGTGRKKDKYGSLAAVGMMSGATLMSLAMAALAAMAGKALMASLLALMLAGIAALKGNGEGDHKTTYEIVAKPVVSHQHTHSSEVIHGGHGGGHHYKRSIMAQPLAYRMQIPK